jgi:hypothetical protein
MTSLTTPDSEGFPALEDEEPADEHETRAYLIERSNRPFAPILKAFVQNPDQKLKDRSAPLALFVRNGDLRGLRALLFLHAIISSGDGDNGWSTTLPLATWARAFDTTTGADRRSASTAATKVLTRLTSRKLIRRARAGRARQVTVTLLRPDGSGAEYTRPDGTSDRFLKLDNRFWTERWYQRLDLPATAMLLVALHEKPVFELPTEHMPEWYGFSADTAERGLKKLRDLGLIRVYARTKKAPLAPTGATQVNVYTLVAPFAPGPASTIPARGAAKSAAARGGSTNASRGASGKKTSRQRPPRREGKKP